MAYNFLELLFWLLFYHALGDFPLQGPYLPLLKDRNSDLNATEQKAGWGLFWHGMIHGGLVAYATGICLAGNRRVDLAHGDRLLQMREASELCSGSVVAHRLQVRLGGYRDQPQCLSYMRSRRLPRSCAGRL